LPDWSSLRNAILKDEKHVGGRYQRREKGKQGLGQRVVMTRGGKKKGGKTKKHIKEE